MSAPGWDERDYKLWSAIQQLPSYGLVSGGNPLLSRESVYEAMRILAKERFDVEWKRREIANGGRAK